MLTRLRYSHAYARLLVGLPVDSVADRLQSFNLQPASESVVRGTTLSFNLAAIHLHTLSSGMVGDTTNSNLDVALPAGNAPLEAKQGAAALMSAVRGGGGFANGVQARIVLDEVAVDTSRDAPSRKETRVVCSLVVTQDMLNAGGNLHGGCSAYLVDLCSSIALSAAGYFTTVSQALNMLYHAPAPLGHKLRIVNRTLTMGSRVLSARTEIWDATDERLVASGIHIKMTPSEPKL